MFEKINPFGKKNEVRGQNVHERGESEQEAREDMPTFGYSYKALDIRIVNPEKSERDRELHAQIETHNNSIFENNENRTVIGVEVTDPEHATRCAMNIDPQHLGGDPSTAAIEAALTVVLPEGDLLFTTTRPDIDSIGAMAVLSLRNKGMEITEDMMDRIKQIADSDKFVRGSYPGTHPFPTEEQLWINEDEGKLAPIASEITDFRVPMENRVEAMEEWIKTGKEPDGRHEQVHKERLDMIRALESGEIAHKTVAGGRIAVVESTHRAATTIGYCRAPVVIAFNPVFPTKGATYKKYTICTYEEKYADIQGALTELAEEEKGWGGQRSKDGLGVKIGGSPQGISSELTMEQVIEIVEKHLKE